MQDYIVRELTAADRQQFDCVFSDTIQNQFPEYSQKAKNYFISNSAYKDAHLCGVLSL